MSLPQRFSDWFSSRGWAPRPHQLAVLEHAQARESALLISPTGGGKTLAGFLPSLIEISARTERGEGIHTLYISPSRPAPETRRTPSASASVRSRRTS
jgi:ATP-dependent Lhr-like helicase